MRQTEDCFGLGVRTQGRRRMVGVGREKGESQRGSGEAACPIEVSLLLSPDLQYSQLTHGMLDVRGVLLERG